MNCPDVRAHLLELQRDRLAPELRREISGHLETCAACAKANEAERVLSNLLEARLPRHPASPELKRRLAQVAAPAAAPTLATFAMTVSMLMHSMARARWMRAVAPALAALLVVGGALVVVDHTGPRESGALASMTSEAVNDHLRILNSAHPFDIESSANHQVKPWFEGKLDFAPVVPEPAVEDLRLEGGAVGYFFDRKAAVVMYGLRRHAVTMLVFRAEGLAWPSGTARRFGSVEARATSARGFHVVFWRSGELGYALVSDIDPKELDAVAAQFAPST